MFSRGYIIYSKISGLVYANTIYKYISIVAYYNTNLSTPKMSTALHLKTIITTQN